MAAGQWSAIGDGGGLWSPQALESLFPDEQPAAAQLGFFGGSLAQLAPPPPLCAIALLGYPQDNFDVFNEQDLAQVAAQVAQKKELQEKQAALLHPKVAPQLAFPKYSILDRVDNSSSFKPATSVLTPQHVTSVIAASMQGMSTLPSHTGSGSMNTGPTGILQVLQGSSTTLDSINTGSAGVLQVLQGSSTTLDSINTGSAGFLEALQGSSITLDKPADDGYNWRKYGQKAVKGGKCPRSYYKCTLNCPVRKNVEHSADGRIIKIVYRGQHCHEPPSKRFKDCGDLLNELDELNDAEEPSTRSLLGCQGYYGKPKPITPNGTMVDGLLPTKEEGDEQLSSLSDIREDDGEIRTVDGDVGDADANERNAPGQKIIVSTTSDVDLLDDGYRWRKYGQKVVRGNPHPRSYYKCTYQGCDVKKHVERSSQEPHAVITTYEGKHTHDVPESRNRSQATGSHHCKEQTYSEQPAASFCSSSEKRKYGTVILNDLAF
ncbi:probable WRKY transcription factor 4 isoform X1 [Hordeum vulgare subsp. vulgare]|uniref:probable WRKY transcription factor 4 isoform X1 n=1 Tax=Hordeum vulgare subsp. vulgare TaxID=112509 RepID=UPI0002958030|nr:probable WRKY transcription factor 4 isoform X1 [Hordeum vulgare subsp. vulgare]